MIVVQKPGSLLPKGFARRVQPLGKLPHRFLAAVVKAVHAGDDHCIRAKPFCFLRNCLRVPFNASQILMDTDHVQPGFFHQALPIQIAAAAHGHPGRFRQHTNQKTHGVQHKAAQLDAVIARRPYGGKGFPNRVFIFQNRTQHKLLNCFPCHGYTTLMICPGVIPFSLKLSTQT